MSSSVLIQETLMQVDGAKGRFYNPLGICKMLKLPSWRAALSDLTQDIDKIVIPASGDKATSYALTHTGVKKLISTVDVKAVKLDPSILQHFDVHITSTNTSSDSDKGKPLRKNIFVGYLRAVYPDHSVEINKPVPGTKKSFDILIKPDKPEKKTAIAIICDSERKSVSLLTDEEASMEYRLKAATSLDLKWLAFPNYEAAQADMSFFHLLAEINAILFPTPAAKTRTRAPRSPKDSEDKKKNKKEEDKKDKKEQDKKDKKSKKEEDKKEKKDKKAKKEEDKKEKKEKKTEMNGSDI